MSMSLSEYISGYVAELEYDSLPGPVREMALRAVYNYMACLAGGVNEPEPQTVAAMLKMVGSAGSCRLPGTELYADPAAMALFCGTAANALGFDDMYKGGIYHPGVPAISAALAVCGLVRPSGRELLTAVVAGYEVANRIAKTVNPSHYRYWHTAATVGCFGAAVSAGKLLGLTAAELVSALGAAGTQAGGLQECNGNMAQRLHLGTASRNGVTAALLAKSGFDGPKNILDGSSGFIAAYSDFEGEIMDSFADLGKNHSILETTFKFYPCCGHIHACIDAALFALDESGFRAEDLREIRVATYQTAISNSGNPAPESILQAKFSIAYCVAAGISAGELTMHEFERWPPSPVITELMDKVSLSVDTVCEENFYSGKRGAVVTLATDSGEHTTARYSRRGDPDCPLTLDDLRRKLVTLSGGAARKLGSALERLPQLEDVSVLLDF